MRPLPIPFAKRTVFNRAGHGELAFVNDAMAVACGCVSGHIKLLNGVEGATGGFGREHIESHPNRMKQIEGLGFADVISYVNFVLTDFTHLAKQPDGRLVVIKQHGRLFHQVICQWDVSLEIWSITTAIPKNNMRNLTALWVR